MSLACIPVYVKSRKLIKLMSLFDLDNTNSPVLVVSNCFVHVRDTFCSEMAFLALFCND